MTHPEAVQQAMDRVSQNTRRTIMRELEIVSEPTPLPPADHPQYELIRAQHGIARLLARMRSV
ncbi:MAG: hypothetical protein HOY75_13185 [Streptomyces sp.]|nr:hypothetical protein [Streptomyces sp.]